MPNTQITPPDAYSQSSLKMFASCPGAWARYRRGDEYTPGAPLIVGSVFADLSAAYDDERRRARLAVLDGSHIEQVFDHVMSGHPEAAPYTGELRSLFVEYAEREADMTGLSEIEKEFAGVHTPKGRHLKGRIDRVYVGTVGVTVRDQKTDRSMLSRAAAKDDFQVRLYAYSAHRLYGVNTVIGQLEFVRFGSRIRDAEFGLTDLEVIGEEMDRRIDAVEAACETQDFPFTVGDGCAWCHYSGDCPKIASLSKKADAIVIVDEDSHRRVATEYLALKLRLGMVTDILKSWSTVHGNIDVNGIAVGFHLSERYEYPVGPIAKLLEAADMDPLMFAKIDATKIKKLAKSAPGIWSGIEAMRTDASRTEFREKRSKGGDDDAE